MSKRNPKPRLDPERCAECGGLLTERRAPWYIALPDGTVKGKYHAGCAWTVCASLKSGRPTTIRTANTYGDLTPPARQETLPW